MLVAGMVATWAGKMVDETVGMRVDEMAVMMGAWKVGERVVT